MHSSEPERANWQLYKCFLIKLRCQAVFEGVGAFPSYIVYTSDELTCMTTEHF